MSEGARGRLGEGETLERERHERRGESREGERKMKNEE